MAALSNLCRLCCDTIEKNDVEVIEEGLRGMLRSILTEIDLTISKNPVICNTCRKKLEANYNFKRKCIFTEDCITPFVTENVKLNLKEVRNQIIKSEDMENDKNVCRLCLTFVDNDMTLNSIEKEQFQQFFPEVDLSRTNFVILCSTCYDLLHKYFIFVTSCMELEQQLCNYSLDQTENKINSSEEDVGIKLEYVQEIIRNLKEEDKNEVELNEELDIKCDNEEAGEQIAEEQNYNSIQDQEILSDKSKNCRNDNLKMHICDKCDYKTKRKSCLKDHILSKHTDPSTIKMNKCHKCSYQSKWKSTLSRHILLKHTDPRMIKMHKCEHCDFQSTEKGNLNVHNLRKHTDLSQIQMSKCEKCDYQSITKVDLKNHILSHHTSSSEAKLHECDKCGYQCKWKWMLNRHIMLKHTDPLMIKTHKCEQCEYKSKERGNLKKHILRKHSDLSLSQVQLYKCADCNYQSVTKGNLKSHILLKHFNSSEIKMHKCEICHHQYKLKSGLTSHILKKHSSDG